MTHHPEAEEFLQHLIGPDHACSAAISLRQQITEEVANRARSVTLVPASGQISVDITEQVADAVVERLGEFRALHAEHHLEGSTDGDEG